MQNPAQTPITRFMLGNHLGSRYLEPYAKMADDDTLRKLADWIRPTRSTSALPLKADIRATKANVR